MSEERAHPESPNAELKERIHRIIFEADTPAGKLFDVVLLVAILASVLAVALESVHEIDAEYHAALAFAEWCFTILFTIEYVLRLYCVRRPVAYARSFFGIVDLLSILPTYLSVLIPGAQSMLVIRALRLLRVFRIFKLVRMLREARALRSALLASRAKIGVFLSTVLIIVVIMGTAMHLVEGGENEGFDSIPQSMYWAIVTMTTVGYGDTTPVTVFGKTLAALMMILGYSLIIVPTGILSAELTRHDRIDASSRSCPSCLAEGHDPAAKFCKYCGSDLNPVEDNGS